MNYVVEFWQESLCLMPHYYHYAFIQEVNQFLKQYEYDHNIYKVFSSEGQFTASVYSTLTLKCS